MTKPEVQWSQAFERMAARRRRSALDKHLGLFEEFVLQAGAAPDDVSFLDTSEAGVYTSAVGAVAVRFGGEDAAVVLLAPRAVASNQRSQLTAFAVGSCPVCGRAATLAPHVVFPDPDAWGQDSEALRAALGEAFALQAVHRGHDCARRPTGSSEDLDPGQYR